MATFLNMTNTTRRRLINASAAVLFMILFGAIGFRAFENWSWFESLYVATQTVTTVGYGDIPPMTDSGRIFAIVFMVLGVGTVLFALTNIVQSIVESEVLDLLDVRRRSKQMEKLNNHFIVCGAGRVGRRIIRNLQKERLPFVVIERDERKLADLDPENHHFLVGDATLEENLIQAGVRQASGLASCLPDDAANVYVVLTARGLNESMHIVARAVEEEAEPKLIRAGANRVVAPTIIGSQSMARALLKPAIADFMDSIVAETLDLVFEEVSVSMHSPLAGKRLKETNLSRELSLIVIAIRRKSGHLHFHPVGETAIEEGDMLIVVGKADSMKALVESNK